MTDDTNKAGLHPEVVKWCRDMALAARLHRRPIEVVRDFDRLLAMARGEAALVETEHVVENTGDLISVVGEEKK